MGARLDSLAAPFPDGAAPLPYPGGRVNLNIQAAGVNLNSRSAAGAGQVSRPFRLYEPLPFFGRTVRVT